MNVAVVGPGDEATEQDLADAHELGRLIAREGWTLLTGGLGGVMLAASAGCEEGGGVVVGILPGTNPLDANRSVTVPLPTGLGEMRNALLVASADCIIGVGCSWGSLSEIAFAVRTGKPTVQIRGWQILDGEGVPIKGPVQSDSPAGALLEVRVIMTGADN